MEIHQSKTLDERLIELGDVPKRMRGLDQKLSDRLRRNEYLPDKLARDVNDLEEVVQKRGEIIKGQQILYMIIYYFRQIPDLSYCYAAGAIHKVTWGKLPYGDTPKGMRAYLHTIDHIRAKMNQAEAPGTDSMRSIIYEQMEKSVVLKHDLREFQRNRNKAEERLPGGKYTEQALRNIIDEYIKFEEEKDAKKAGLSVFEKIANDQVPDLFGTVGKKRDRDKRPSGATKSESEKPKRDRKKKKDRKEKKKDGSEADGDKPQTEKTRGRERERREPKKKG